MDKLISIDIVLIPSTSVVTFALRVNRSIRKNQIIHLDRKDRRPHISLAIACIARNNLFQVIQLLKETKQKFHSMNLVIEGTEQDKNYHQIHPTLWFKIKKSTEILKLHRAIMKRIKPFEEKNVPIDSFYRKGEKIVTDSTRRWVLNYRKKASFRKFQPHITLGKGPLLKNSNFPISFETHRLALFQLGNHCTCRKMIYQVHL